jgi:hypothetical protein
LEKSIDSTPSVNLEFEIILGDGEVSLALVE